MSNKITQQEIDYLTQMVESKNRSNWTQAVNDLKSDVSPDSIRKAWNVSKYSGYSVSQYYKELIANNGSLKSVDENEIIEKEVNSYKSSQSIEKDGMMSSNKLLLISSEQLKDSSFLLAAHGFDLLKWELVSAKNNIWNVYSKQDGIQELYSSKITVKPITEITRKEIEEFYINLVSNYKPPVIKKYKTYDDSYLVKLPVFDVHFGKYSTYEMVGNEYYNSDIARDCFNYVIDYTISRIKKLGIKVDKLIFPVGQDFFHFDTPSKTTTGGTPQDTDTNNKEMFKNGCMMLIDGISKLSSELKTQVDVCCVDGNHDSQTSYNATMVLWAYFNNDENVNVDTSVTTRKYIEYGNSLIGLSHGSKEKKRISGIMQIEAPEKWGRTKFREFHLGHLHSEQTTEENGVIIRNIPSITGTDRWHNEQGYVGAIRKCVCFIWSKEKGIDSTFNIMV